MYRPSANPPKTAWARHLDQVMRDRNWSRVRLFEEVAAEMGYAPKSRSAILPLLEDRNPTPAQEAVLRKHFGEPPAEPEPVVQPPQDALVAALNRQADAIEQLVARFDQLASEAIRAGVADALREAGVHPTGGASPASRLGELTA